MAMPSGNVVISDTMQFQNESGGGEVHHRQWFPDERDGFISWLRGEFASANAIIDLLCHHLWSIGEPSEYEVVIGSIQQRRCNWSPVLHMQQYFSVAEVMFALQEAAWRKQQRNFDQMKAMEKDTRKPASQSVGPRQGYRTSIVKETHRSSSEPHHPDANPSAQSVTLDLQNAEEEPEIGEIVKQRGKVERSDEKGSAISEKKDSSLNGSENPEATGSEYLDPEVVDDGCSSNLKGTCNALQISGANANQDEKQNLTSIPKKFVGTEMFDGRTVNVVEGLKLYEEIFDSSEISKLVSLVNELRAAGRRGQSQGQTFVISKRPMKGRGREIIQLGLPIVDAPPEDENMASTSKDQKTEAIPCLLQDVIDRLVRSQVMTVKPDSCIIDFFNEGDHSQPHMYPPWFGRPVCILFLTECNMTFGRVIGVEQPGEYRGSLKLSLAAGSLLMMQGRSADFAKHAISSLCKQRILVTFTKSKPKRTMGSDGLPLPSITAAPSSSPLVPPPSRPLSHVRNPVGAKHYGVVPTTGVLPAPPIRHQHLPPPNGLQPLFVPTPVAPPGPYPAPVPLPPSSAGWATVSPRHPPPRLPVPGTGVFFPPPGSGHLLFPQLPVSATATEMKFAVEAPFPPENENGLEKSNNNSIASPKGKLDGKEQRQECNGSIRGTGVGRVVGKEEQQHSSPKKKVASKPTGTIK